MAVDYFYDNWSPAKPRGSLTLLIITDWVRLEQVMFEIFVTVANAGICYPAQQTGRRP